MVLEATGGLQAQTLAALVARRRELVALRTAEKSRRKSAALVGVAPLNRDSGTLRGRRSICGGRPAGRATLYMAAVTAARCNPTIAAMFQRLRNSGKPAKVALTACMRKLLTILNAIARDRQA